MGISNISRDLHSGIFSECGMQQFNPNKNPGVDIMEGIWMKFQGLLEPRIRQSSEVFWALNTVKLVYMVYGI